MYEWRAYDAIPTDVLTIDEIPDDLRRFLSLRAAASNPQQQPGFSNKSDMLSAFDSLDETTPFACYSGREIVGAMTLDMAPRGDRGIWLDTLAVAPSLRRCAGIGRSGLVLAAHEATRAKAKYVIGHATEHALPFYVKHGFEIDRWSGGDLTRIIGATTNILRACRRQS